MTTLTDFLLARFSEDEANAKYAHTVGADCVAFDGGDRPATLSVAHDYSPDRALVECEAKRRIVEWAAMEPIDVQVLYFLALPYADHPDCRQEWKP